jgi:hypothetical protein
MSIVKLNNNGVKNATAFGSITGLGEMALIKTITLASAAATIDFVNGVSDVVLDGTYKEYIFYLNNIHPASDNITFQFNGSDDTSSHAYNITKTTTAFNAYHSESDGEASLGYRAADDLPQGTGFHTLSNQASNDNDACLAGHFHLFEPANTTFVKHFTARISGNNEDNHAQDNYSAGYFNTTAAITAIQFKFGSGNIDAGSISLYGVN